MINPAKYVIPFFPALLLAAFTAAVWIGTNAYESSNLIKAENSKCQVIGPSFEESNRLYLKLKCEDSDKEFNYVGVTEKNNFLEILQNNQKPTFVLCTINSLNRVNECRAS